MRKLFYCGLFLSIVGISVVSCKKDIIKSPTNNSSNATSKNEKSMGGNSQFDSEFQLGNEGRFLVFSSENGYIHAVDNPSDVVRQNLLERMSSLNHYSWKEYVKNNSTPGLDTVIKDDYFASILSLDKTIQIGQHIFKINPETEQVFALHVKDKKDYNDLKNNVISNPKIRVFSFNENVLDAIKIIGGDPTPPGIFCSDTYAPVRNEFISATIPLNYGNVIIIDMRAKYFAAGIYFNLKAFVSSFSQGLSWNDLSSDFPQYVYQNYGVYLKLDGRRRYKERCKTDTGYQYISAQGSGSQGVVLQSYMGSRGLNKYQLISNVYFMYNGQWHNVTEIPSLIPNSSIGQTGNNYSGYYYGVTYGY